MYSPAGAARPNERGTCAGSWGRAAVDKERTAAVAVSVTLHLFLPRHQKGERP